MLLIEPVNHLGAAASIPRLFPPRHQGITSPVFHSFSSSDVGGNIVARGTASPCCNRGPLLGRRKRNTAVSLRSSWAGLFFLREITGESGGWKRKADAII